MPGAGASDDWRFLLRDEVQRWLRSHEDDDPARLALAPFPFAPESRILALDQVKARRKAREKLPRWHGTPGVVLPRSDLVEQASSEATACYKAGLARGERFVDLTAGVGVDALAWSGSFASGTCVECDPRAADLLRHNLGLLARTPPEVVDADADEYAASMPSADLAYLDPERRDRERGRRGHLLAGGRPDPVALIPRLAGNAARVVLKASPMLDLAQAAAELPGVIGIHVVEWRGECRELLLEIDPSACGAASSPRIRCVVIDDRGAVARAFAFTADEERAASAVMSAPRRFIVEPSPAVLKAGAFKLVASRYGLAKLHPSTHLYTADDLAQVPADLPAKVFELIAVLRVDPTEVAAALPERRARLKLRNFPGSSAALLGRLRLSEGGDDVLIACTLESERTALLHVRPLTPQA